jgi:small-conductance mechanosensitive channel
MPPVLYEVSFLDVAAWQWLGLVLGLALAGLAAVGLGWIARRIVLRLAQRTRVTWDEALVEAATGPGQWLLGVATLALAARALRLAIPVQEVIDHLLETATVVLLTWAVLRVLRLAADLLGARTSPGDGAAARSRLTQVMVLKRVTDFVVMLVGGALVLRQFNALREVGTSLLASASVAGIVVGLAAQRSIAMLLAGVQISLTQPLRVGDVVVIEGEWGSIEEITLTYVVVKVWDLRRLVVPITRILDAPFQNWTRAGSELLGTVLMYADYRLPVGEVRRELERFVKGRPEWDGKAVALQVTGATDRTIELRAVVSSASSSQSWDLRCAVREHLLAFVQQLEGGAFLPRVRIEPPARAGGHARLPSAKGGSPSATERNTAHPRG